MFAEIVFATAPTAFTYAVDAAVQPGDLVEAPLRGKLQPGLALSLSPEKPAYAVKNVAQILRAGVLPPAQTALAAWTAEYYASGAGAAARLFLPERVWQSRPLKRAAKIPVLPAHPQPSKPLNAAQKSALAEIVKSLEGNSKFKIQNSKFLLHGITGSGKTEVYLQAILQAISQGRQAILLVPEIALTPQLTGYLAATVPPAKIAVLHSGLAAGAWLSAWERIRAGEIALVVGSRSALFAPLPHLGLIILDEEHEWTYKNDSAPRYHARAVAQKLAELTSSTLVLGSATPAVETFAAAKAGRIKLLALPTRARGGVLPPVTIVDLRQELKKQNYSPFSELLAAKITDRLARGEQTILFLNKRGFASSLTCRDCGQAVTCPDCAIAQTLHRRPRERLCCHLCGRENSPPQFCPACGSPRLKELGSGTQKLETELKIRWPAARVLRADRDTTGTVGSHAEIFEALKNGAADILLGTQMIAKGLDLPRVTLVGVLLADHGLHLPDFRAAEKTFSLLTQVAGRAGRAEAAGEVVLQTYSPAHPAILAAAAHDYAAFFTAEIAERRALDYPPFSRMIKFEFVNVVEKVARDGAEQLAAELKKRDPAARVSAAPALVARQHGKYHHQVFWRGHAPRAVLAGLVIPPGCRIDVDPISLV